MAFNTSIVPLFYGYVIWILDIWKNLISLILVSRASRNSHNFCGWKILFFHKVWIGLTRSVLSYIIKKDPIKTTFIFRGRPRSSDSPFVCTCAHHSSSPHSCYGSIFEEIRWLCRDMWGESIIMAVHIYYYIGHNKV